MNRSMMSRLTAAAVSVALLAAGLAGCGGSGDAETAEGEMIISVNNSEPQSPLAYHVFATASKTMYRIGAALELKRLGYKFEKMDLPSC